MLFRHVIVEIDAIIMGEALMGEALMGRAS